MRHRLLYNTSSPSGYTKNLSQDTPETGSYLATYAAALNTQPAVSLKILDTRRQQDHVLFAAMYLANPGITVLAFINLALFGIVIA